MLDDPKVDVAIISTTYIQQTGLSPVNDSVFIECSTVFEPVRKEVKGYVVDPLGKHHFENVSIE